MTAKVWTIGIIALGALTGLDARAADIPNAEKIKIAEAAELKGDVARAREHFEEAANYYRQAVKATPTNAQIYNKLGITYLQLNEHGSARKSFSKAIKYEPHFVNALNNLGAVNTLEKKYNPAIRYLKQALALDETNASAHLNLAEAWIGLGDMDRAMTEYARAVELNPDILSGTPDGVMVHVNTPQQKGRVQFLLARALAQRGNMEGALEYLQRAKDNRYADMARVYQEKAFAPLWDDPRLQKIVKR